MATRFFSTTMGQAGDCLHPNAFLWMVLNFRIGLELLIVEGLTPLCEEGLLVANSQGIYLTAKGAAAL